MMPKQEANPSNALPYVTALNILFIHLEKIDVLALARDVKDQWYNQTLCQVNVSVIRLGVMQGEYHWHRHHNDDAPPRDLHRLRALPKSKGSRVLQRATRLTRIGPSAMPD
jgi:hypothetical protein